MLAETMMIRLNGTEAKIETDTKTAFLVLKALQTVYPNVEVMTNKSKEYQSLATFHTGKRR